MTNVRVRIAPSPTGPLHVGTARTALFNYLFAKKQGGKFVLRIEDTDLERSDPKFEKDIFEGLRWLGIEPNESPKKLGPYGPYRQSERISSYQKYLEQLWHDGKIFFCFHSEGEIQEGDTDPYQPHRCNYRTLRNDEQLIIKSQKDAEYGKGTGQYVLRFKTPAGVKLKFNDLVRGEVEFQSDLLGDFSAGKDLDVPLYNFAVVIDDEEMKISHVIRGEDHLSNTPKQILILEALGFKRPFYAHLSLILGPDRSKLSKRHGATSIGEYRKMGYLPDALVNFMALLGWNPGDNREILSKEELIKEFSLERIQKSGAVFDVNKLDWMNGEYIRKTNIRELQKKLKALKLFSELKDYDDTYFFKILGVEQGRIHKLSEIKEDSYFFREPVYAKELLQWKEMTVSDIHSSLVASSVVLKELAGKEFTRENIEKAFLKKAHEFKDRGELLWPLRVALTGKKDSPGPFEVMEVLGIEESLTRIKLAKEKLSR